MVQEEDQILAEADTAGDTGFIDATEDQLLKALEDALAQVEGGKSGALTRREIEERFDWSTKATLKALRILKDKGLLEPVQVKRRGLDDKLRPVPAYKLAKVVDNKETQDPQDDVL